MRQGLDKRGQLVRRQCAIDIAVAFCHLRRKIVATQEYFQGASPSHEPWQSLRRATARNEPHSHLRLAEDGLAKGGEAHVHRQHDLAPAAPGPSLDFGDGHFRHVPEPLADHLRETKAARMGHGFGRGTDPTQTRVGNEEIGKCALQDYNPDSLVDLKFATEPVEFLRQNLIEKIYRWVIDADECDTCIEDDPKTVVVGILHE